jgi:hypothetical protein
MLFISGEAGVSKTLLVEMALLELSSEVTPNALEAAASRLRRRLAAEGANVVLHMAHGVGYMLMAAREQQGSAAGSDSADGA